MTNAGAVALTVLALAAGALYWRSLVKRRVAASEKSLFAILLAAGLAARLLSAALVPTYYAPDEEMHLAYVRHLNDTGSFPVIVGPASRAKLTGEYYQPPLYYLLLQPLHRAATAATSDARVVVRALRLTSIACWVILAWMVLRLLDRLPVRDPFVRVFTLAMVCLQPSHVHVTAAINNDNLLMAIGAVFFVRLAQPHSRRNAAVLGACLGLSLLTKMSGPVFAAMLAASLAEAWFRGRIGAREAALQLGLALGVAVAIFLPWGLRCWWVYGDPTSISAGNTPVQWRSLGQALPIVLSYMHDTFWASAGVIHNFIFLPQIGHGLFYASLIGAAAGLLRRDRTRTDFVGPQLRAYLPGALTGVLVNFAALTWFGTMFLQGHGRSLLPTLPLIGLLMAIGLRHLVDPARHASAGAHVTGFFFTWSLMFLVCELATYQAWDAGGILWKYVLP